MWPTLSYFALRRLFLIMGEAPRRIIPLRALG